MSVFKIQIERLVKSGRNNRNSGLPAEMFGAVYIVEMLPDF